MEKVDYKQYAKEFMEVLPKGVFLTVKVEDEVNTMTIGWANLGYIWGKPVLMVMVRESRYTYQLLEKTDEFTVSIPLNGGMKEELSFCGSNSGRDHDKFKECDLTSVTGQNVDTPLIEECDLHYECKIKFKQEMREKGLKEEINSNWYSDNDYHTLYFGEIVGCYKK